MDFSGIKHKAEVIYFYKSYCPYCQRYSEDKKEGWEALAGKYKNNKDIRFVKYNLEDKSNVQNFFNIVTVPNIKMITINKKEKKPKIDIHESFDGQRTVKNISEYIDSKL
jgi:thiol-disulfide isomerase/thioredoxin